MSVKTVNVAHGANKSNSSKCSNLPPLLVQVRHAAAEEQERAEEVRVAGGAGAEGARPLPRERAGRVALALTQEQQQRRQGGRRLNGLLAVFWAYFQNAVS